jgi:aryl-alcohol dehydrogenase-like predicted oxidoreductase
VLAALKVSYYDRTVHIDQLGCMGMTAFYGDFDRGAAEDENLATIAKALELGINFFDTAWIYQSFGLGTHVISTDTFEIVL